MLLSGALRLLRACALVADGTLHCCWYAYCPLCGSIGSRRAVRAGLRAAVRQRGKCQHKSHSVTKCGIEMLQFWFCGHSCTLITLLMSHACYMASLVFPSRIQVHINMSKLWSHTWVVRLGHPLQAAGHTNTAHAFVTFSSKPITDVVCLMSCVASPDCLLNCAKPQGGVVIEGMGRLLQRVHTLCTSVGEMQVVSQGKGFEIADLHSLLHRVG